MIEEQEIKQTYLRKEILDENIEPQKFIDFLVSKKGEGADDINNWSINELKSVVNEFKSLKKSKESKNKNLSHNPLFVDVPPADIPNLLINEEEKKTAFNTPLPLSSNNINSNNTNYNKSKKYKYEENNENDNDNWELIRPSICRESFANNLKNLDLNNSSYCNFRESLSYENIINNNNNIIFEIECLEPDNTPLSNYSSDQISIKISFPEKISENLGFKGFFSYKYYFSFPLEITIPQKKIKINRTFDDFLWLRKTFIKIYPGVYIPPLPQKSLGINEEERKLEKYRNYIENFMKDLLSDNLTKNSSLLYLFLMTEKKNEFQEIIDNYDKKVKKPNDIHYFYDREGKIILDDKVLDTNVEKKLLIDENNQINNYQKFYNKLNKSLKLLEKDINQVSIRMNEISELFKEIYEMTILNNDSKNDENNKNLCDLNINLCKEFNCLRNIFKELSENENYKIKKFVRESKNYFKYVKLKYSLAYKELYDNYEYCNRLYKKVSTKLNQRKEILFNEKDIKKWQISNKNVDYNTLNINLNDKNECFEKMLPKENAIVRQIQKLLIYYATKLINEKQIIINGIDKQNCELIQKLKNYGEIQNKKMSKFWNMINTQEKNE